MAILANSASISQGQVRCEQPPTIRIISVVESMYNTNTNYCVMIIWKYDLTLHIRYSLPNSYKDPLDCIVFCYPVHRPLKICTIISNWFLVEI